MTGARRKCGFTLVSVMVGISLAMIASVAALATFQVLRDSYAITADSVLIEERGQRALAIIAHAVRQAGWIPAHVSMSAAHPAPDAPIEGRDDCGQLSSQPQMQCTRSGVAASDALIVRVSGSGQPTDNTLPDGTMSDCSGYALPATATPANDGPLPYHAATNLFYIGKASDGVPQLLCRYPTRQGNRVVTTAYTAGTLVRGVETMQLRYGVDRDDDGNPDRFVPARTVEELGEGAWHRVRAVQISMVVRGDRRTAQPYPGDALQLFPVQAEGDTSADSSFQLPARSPVRRRVFSTTIRLRNPSPCMEAKC
jgi:type IV pilus assembly protein PilW